MDIFRTIAERKITEAMINGEFDNLPGKGKRLAFDDETWIPEDLRISYRFLKNAGYLPPELEFRKEIINLKNMLETIDDDRERSMKMREINYKLMSMNLLRKKPCTLEDFPRYHDRFVEKVISGENS